HGQTALIAVDTEAIRAVPAHEVGRNVAAGVSPGRFDLDHFRPQIGKYLRAEGPGQKGGQVEHPLSGQGLTARFHHVRSSRLMPFRTGEWRMRRDPALQYRHRWRHSRLAVHRPPDDRQPDPSIASTPLPPAPRRWPRQDGPWTTDRHWD